jgi:hypothetical protein
VLFRSTYVNAIDAEAKVFDGFFLHGRPGAGATFDGTMLRSRNRNTDGSSPLIATECVRTDARVPVIVLQTETDLVVLGSGPCAQPDGDHLVEWQLAGAAHADTYLLMASSHDTGSLPAARLAELIRPVDQIRGFPTGLPINSGPHQHYVGQAALEPLDRWVAGGPRPPAAARLELLPAGDEFRRDHLGIAIGGLRTPWVDAPTAVLSGLGQSGDGFSFLFGSTTALDPAVLAGLYPGGRGDYLAAATTALDAAIAAGHILAEDREEILGVMAAGFDLV